MNDDTKIRFVAQLPVIRVYEYFLLLKQHGFTKKSVDVVKVTLAGHMITGSDKATTLLQVIKKESVLQICNMANI
jgi:hypothetical protein